ncbi:MAG: hypothetical protein ACK4UN_02965 [Limisphaerales bacterium]
MQPLFANGINMGFVAGYGLLVLLPLILFQVAVEGAIYRFLWKVPFREMASLAFRNNCWSLLAGIPVKIVNASIYEKFLVGNLVEFFQRYPLVVGLGTAFYFVVTVLVEILVTRRWRNRNYPEWQPGGLARGVLIANVVTYSVLAPVHYYATRPRPDLSELTPRTTWTQNPDTKIFFIDPADQFLKSVRADGTAPSVIVPIPLRDYLLSEDLNICLFRGTDNNLHLYRRDPPATNLIWETKEKFFMDQVAFSGTGEMAAFVSHDESRLEIINLTTGTRHLHPVGKETRLAWSKNENELYAASPETRAFLIHITADGRVEFTNQSNTNPFAVLPCFGRVPNAKISKDRGIEWGPSYEFDECESLIAYSRQTLPLYFTHPSERRTIWKLSFNYGLMGLGGIRFREVAFIGDCSEAVLQANQHIYIADPNKKRLGLLTPGEKFSIISERYRKQL